MPDAPFSESVPILRELREDLDAAYAAAAPTTDESPPHLRRASRSRRRLTAGIAMLAGVLVATIAALPAGERATGAILEAAAATAAAQQPTTPPPGEYAHFKENSLTPKIGMTLEWWIARDGSGRLLQRLVVDEHWPGGNGEPSAGGYVFDGPGDDPELPAWRRAGNRWTRQIDFGAGEFVEVNRRVAPQAIELDVGALPTDPDALASALRRKLQAAATDGDPETGFKPAPRRAGSPVESDVNAQMLTVITQALGYPLTSPAQRSALYQVAAGLPGVEALEGVKDPTDRPATLLRLDRELSMGGNARVEIYFDPKTAAMLAWRDVTSENGRTTTDGRVYSPLTTVSRLPERDSAD